MSKLAALLTAIRDMLAGLGRSWKQFWFVDSPTAPLEVVRIILGAALFVHYALATPTLLLLWGDSGWMPRAYLMENADAWRQSVFFYFTAPWQWYAFHALFLFCCAALTVGWRTAWVKWIVLVGQISFVYRNPSLFYAPDKVVDALLVILCVAPVGRALSLDRLRAVRRAKREQPDAVLPVYSSPWAGACIKLMQIQMVLILFFNGLNKIKQQEWWTGDAIWQLLTINDYYVRVTANVLAHNYWLVTLATYATILIEIAYPSLIWQRRTRPYMLAAAVILNALFGLFLGLMYFATVMIAGHMSFLRPEWLARLGEAWKRRLGWVAVNRLEPEPQPSARLTGELMKP